MLESIAQLCSPALRELIGFAVTVVALALLLTKSRGGPRGAILMISLGLIALNVSYIVGISTMIMSVLDPGHPLYVIALVGLRAYVGLPLVALGSVLAIAGAAREGIVGPARLNSAALMTDIPGGDAARLRESLDSANRNLEAARTHIEEQATESDRMSLKLRETLNLLLSSEEKFRSIFERANDGFILLDVNDLKIMQANPRMCELTGHEAEELAGRRLPDFCDDGGSDGSPDNLREQILRGSLPPVVLRRKDSTTVQAEMSFSLVDLGSSPILLGIVRDVSERLRLQDELELKNQILEEGETELRQANERLSEDAAKMREMNDRLLDLQAVKDNFLSSVSHELRTPLTSIRSFSEILLDNVDTEEDVQREFITIINKESERLTRLINDVLDIAKIDAGEMTFDLVPVDLNLVVREVTRSLTPLTHKHGISIESRIPADLPDVLGDRDRLHQVLANLLNNALKFANPDTQVVIRTRRDDEGLVEVSIQDEGPGIPREELPRIFEKFRQVGDTLTDKPAGTGLGLAICREIITLHGGRVWVRSLTGEGSVFYFTLQTVEARKRARSRKSLADRVREAAEKELRGESVELTLASTTPPGGLTPDQGARPESMPEPTPEPLAAPEPELVSVAPVPDPVAAAEPEATPVQVQTRDLQAGLPPIDQDGEHENESRRLPPLLDR